MADDGRLTAELDQIRNVQARAASREGDADARIGAMSLLATEDVPRLVKAVEAALRHHKPQTTANGIIVCPRCSNAAGQAITAPCAEVRDITRELTGEAS